MRKTLLIALIAAAAGAAQAQTPRRPYDPPKPYELPKEFRTNPSEWDYSKPDPNTRGPGYRNVDGSLPSRSGSTSSPGGYGGYSGYGGYGSPSSDNGGGAGSRSRSNPACSRPGVVC